MTNLLNIHHTFASSCSRDKNLLPLLLFLLLLTAPGWSQSPLGQAESQLLFSQKASLDPQIERALFEKDLPRLKQLLKGQTDLKQQPLVALALQWKSPELALFCLQKGSGVHPLRSQKKTPLYLACEFKHLPLYQAIVQRDPNQLKQTFRKRNLYFALAHPSLLKKNDPTLEIAERLRSQKLSFNEADREGLTPLALALSNSQADYANWLLKRGADPTCTTQNELTPLHFACDQPDLKTLATLLQALPPDRKLFFLQDRWQRTPWHLAILRDNPQALRLLSSYQPLTEPQRKRLVFYAQKYRCLKALRALRP